MKTHMNSKWSSVPLLILSTVVTLLWSSALTYSQSWDLGREFSPTNNPNGAWSYGYKSAFGDSLTAFTYHKIGTDERGTPVEIWSKSATTQPMVCHNATTKTNYISGGQGVLPPGSVWLYPGAEGTPYNFGVLCFTVPPAGYGQYEIKTFAQPIYVESLQGDTDFHVVKNGIELFGVGLAKTQCGGYTNTLALAPGDLIEFAIGRGADGRYSASGLIIQASINLLSTNSAPSSVSVPAGIVSWWPGDGDALEIIGGNDGVLKNGTSFAPGKVGQGFKFDGVNDYVLVPDSASLDLTNEITIELWFKADDWNGRPLLDKRAGAASCNYGAIGASAYGLQLYYNDPAVTGGDYPSSGFEISAAKPLPSLGVFHHFAGAFRQVDAANIEMKTYIDGALVRSLVIQGNLARTVNSAPLGIGVEGAGAGAVFKGIIDEVTLYNRALTAPEIQGIFAADSAGKTKPAILPSISAQPQDQTVIAGETATFTVVASGGVSLSYQWRFGETEIIGATAAALTLTNAQMVQAGGYSVVVANDAGSVTSRVAILTVNPPPSSVNAPTGVVSWWPGDGDALDIVSANNGTLTNGAGFATGKVGQGFKLDGVNDYAKIKASSTLDIGTGDGFTIELWINPKNLASLKPLVEWNNGSPGTHLWISAATSDSGGIGSLFANLVDTSGISHQIVTPAGLLVTNTFQHVALTYDKVSGESKLFLNGSEAARANLGSFIPLTTGDLYFGHRPNGPVSGVYYAGIMDEISLYGRALSTAEVEAVYTAGTAGKFKVIQPPTIVYHPQDQTLIEGETTTFTVVASGGVSLSYQWRFGETEIIGATAAALTLTNAQMVQAGGYSVVVANDAGSVTSRVALLTVNAPGTDLRLVLPNECAQQEGQGASSLLSSVIRLQEIYGVSYFPAQPIVIREIKFRPSAIYGAAFNATISNLEIRMSTTPVQPQSLSAMFDSNMGPDQTMVFKGAITLSSAFRGPASGPKSFDIVIPLSTPFFYDPGMGNLLIEYRNYSGSGATFVDAPYTASREAKSRAFALDASAGLATTVDSGPEVLQLTYAPADDLAPVIVAHPQDTSVTAGETATLTVMASGSAPLSYQWYFKGAEITGATGSSLILNNVQVEHAGNYWVVVTNDLGAATSTEAALTVNSTPVASLYDLSRDFSLASNPNGVWSYGYKSDLSNALTLFAFHKIGSDERGTPVEVWSKSAYSQPVVCHNANNITTYISGGQGVLPPGAVWFYPGAEGTPDNFGVLRFTVPPAGDGQYEIKTLVQPIYVASLQGDTDFHVLKNGVEMFGAELAGTQYIGYTNTFALVAGDTIDFAVGRGADGQYYASGLRIQATVDLISANPMPPVIATQPQDQTLLAGEAASLTVVAKGSAPLSYQWNHNGTDIEGAVGPTLSLMNVQTAQAGGYSVVVTNDLGSVTSRVAVLTVTPAPVACLYDLSREFSLSSNPNGVWSYGCENALNSSFIPFTSFKIDYDERGTPVEVWSKTSWSQPQANHNATSKTNYISGGQGVLPPGTVWFYPGPEGTPDNFGVLRFTVPPAGDGQYALKTFVRPVYVASLQGDTDFHVVKNGVELFGVGLAGTEGGGYTNTLTLAAGDTIDFAIGRGADGHYYASGLQIQATFDLASTEPTAPAIVRQPRDLTVVAGEAAGFAVVANGTGPLSYQWRFNGNDLAGATGASLALGNAQAEHAGRYSVVVTNELGAVTSAEAVLTVAAAPEPPAITSQPQSQTVLPGSAVSFSVAVSSTTPVTYQWEFNGGPIAGATAATLSLANVQIARAGTYRVSVANAGGSVTSEEATLMLQAFQQPPTFIAQSGAVAAPAGTDAALWVSAFGSEPLSYQWFFNGAALAGATSSTLTLNNVQAAQAGTYTVAVSNPYGAVTNSGLLLNVVGPAGGGGTVNLANNAANPIYDTDGVTRLAAGAAYRAQLYAGLTPEALQPVGAPVNIGPIPGRFMGGTRVVPTVPPGQTGWFIVKVWESAYGRGYEEARLAGGKHGASEPFEVRTANSTSVPPEIPASLLAMPSFALVPGGVLNPPEITAQPQGQTVALGASVSLSVSATGPGALRYQWFKDENLLAGATGASLNISGAAATDAGAYFVVVNNPAGSVTSLVATVAVTVERQLYLSAPADVSEGDLVNVPLTLVSRGEVGGLTFALTYNPDALTLPEVTWDSALEGALKLANTPAAGRLQGVFAFGSGAVPAGTQVVATISFRARTITATANSALALEVIDLANAAGEPIVFGTAVSGGSLAIASAGSTDNNANGAIDAGDATLLLRLLARLDTIRPWDVARNDLNANGVLDSGDAIKLLRAAAEAGAGQVGPAGILAERAALAPARLRADAGQLVTLQVRLEGLTRPVVAGDFVITYPAGAVRLAPKQAPKVGALMAANALLSYSDDQAGRLHVVISSPGAAGGGSPAVPAEGVLAEVSFEVLAGAAGQYAWGLGLGRALAYSDGYTQRTLAASGAVLIGRSPLAGGLGAVRRQAGGEFAFRLSGDAGADYLVEASADLKTWAPWRTVTAGAEGLELLDSEAATLPQRFYRVRPVE